jgi:hypothetical protein
VVGDGLPLEHHGHACGVLPCLACGVLPWHIPELRGCLACVGWEGKRVLTQHSSAWLRSTQLHSASLRSTPLHTPLPPLRPLPPPLRPLHSAPLKSAAAHATPPRPQPAAIVPAATGRTLTTTLSAAAAPPLGSAWLRLAPLGSAHGFTEKSCVVFQTKSISPFTTTHSCPACPPVQAVCGRSPSGSSLACGRCGTTTRGRPGEGGCWDRWVS